MLFSGDRHKTECNFYVVFVGGVDNELHSMLLNMSPEEQKWLIRILLKDISIGLSQNRILYWFHPDAVDLYDVTNDLQKVSTQYANHRGHV